MIIHLVMVVLLAVYAQFPSFLVFCSRWWGRGRPGAGGDGDAVAGGDDGAGDDRIAGEEGVAGIASSNVVSKRAALEAAEQPMA